MPRKRHSPEQILGKLREVEVALAKGQTVAVAVSQIAVTEQTYYRWRNEYGGLSIDQATRLKQLEQENARFARSTPVSAAIQLRQTLIRRRIPGLPSLPVEMAEIERFLCWPDKGNYQDSSMTAPGCLYLHSFIAL